MANIFGTDGNNVLNGTNADDQIYARGGSDNITAGAGNDLIFIEADPSGNDTVNGGLGIDSLFLEVNYADVTVSFNPVTGRVVFTNNADLTTERVISVEQVGFADRVVLIYGQGSNFASLQDAIDFAPDGALILITPGTYNEQVDITGRNGLSIEAIVADSVTIIAPDSVAVNGASDYYGGDVRAVVAVNGSTDISISGITIDGNFAGDTTVGSNGDEISGVAFIDSTGSLDDVTIQNVSNSPEDGLFGLQHGSGLFIDNSAPAEESDDGPLPDRNAVSITNSTITGFQKTGALIIGAEITFTGNTITGIGATGLTAQNGIQVAQSQGTLSDNIISGIAYTVPENGQYFYSSGIIAYEPSGPLALDGNTITGEGEDGEFTALDLSDTLGVEVSFQNNIIADATNGIIAYSFFGGEFGLDAQPNFDGTTFSGITDTGISFDPEETYGAPFNTDTSFTVTGTDFHDNLAGSDGDDTFSGGGADDDLAGRGGDDSLTGGDGDDSFEGGLGDDIIAGGEGFDDATYADESANYVVTAERAENGLITSFASVTDKDGNVSINYINDSIDEGADTLTSIEQLNFGKETFSVEDPVQAFDADGNVLGTFSTIQDAVDAVDDFEGAVTIIVADGEYSENVVISRSNLTLISANGRDNVTITGVQEGSELGTIQIAPGGFSNVTIGGEGTGFTIIGIDGNGAIEKAAIYLQGAHDGVNILDNDIVANGDAGLLSEFNLANTNILIDGNEFSGQTFIGTQPGGSGFGTQFDVGNNVPRQLLVIGGSTVGGPVNTLSNNITVSNNEFSGTAGGTSSLNGMPQGNTLVTVDAADSVIDGNTFTGFTDRFGVALRVRGPNTDVIDNTIDHSDGGQTRGIEINNQGVPGEYSGNELIGAETADLIFGLTPGDDLANGNGGNDTILSGAGVDTVNGGTGDDILIVGDGDDIVDGGDDNDIITGGLGDDGIDGGDGIDTAVYTGNRDGYTVVLVQEENGRVTGFDQVTDIGEGPMPFAAVDIDEGDDDLTSVEILQFADVTLNAAFGVQVFDADGELVGTYETIQEGVDASSDGYTVKISEGVYDEQVVVEGHHNLTIEAFEGDEVTIIAPDDLEQTGTSTSGREIHSIITVLGSEGVTISGINVDGNGAGNTVSGGNPQFTGIYYQGASGSVLDVDVTGIRDPYETGMTVGGNPVVSGNQRGVGVQVDNYAPDTNEELFTFTMTGGSISDFQKNATVFSNADLNVTGVTITGGGAQTINAQNGIQVLGSTGTISGNTITAIGYAGSQIVYSGIILAYGNTNLDITDNIITGANDETTDAQVGGIFVLDFSSASFANSGGSITGNTISFVDFGIDISGLISPDGILVENNDITDIDENDPFAEGVGLFPTLGSAALDVDGSATFDFLNGGGLDDILSGLAGDDELNGFDGDDTLDGGAGDDELTGGLGDDTYVIDSVNDVINEFANEGIDTVNTSLNSYTLAAALENLAFVGTGNFTGSGNAGDNSITGGAGNDLLRGLAGNDSLFGGLGNDTLAGGGGLNTLAGGDGNDRYNLIVATDVIIENANGGSDTVSTDRFSLNLNNYANVENAELTGALNLNLTGDGVTNILTGNSGNNLIQGGGGYDLLIGGAGADRFVYTSTSDSLAGAANRDVIRDFDGGIFGVDLIDLFAIDARTDRAGNNAFTFIGEDAFTGVSGQLRFSYLGANEERTLIQADTNGDGVADFQILLQTHVELYDGDFLL